MTPTPWYARHAWIVFALMGVLSLVFGVSGEEGPTGADAPFVLLAQGDTSDVGLATQLRGTFALITGVFGILMAAIPFRRHETWAWYAMWAWPVFFVLHIVAFDTLLPDGVFLALTLLALGATAKTALRRGQAADTTAA